MKITNLEIRALRRKAAVSHDYLQVAICEIAEYGTFVPDEWTALDAKDVDKASLMTQEEAIATCEEVIKAK